MKQNMEDPDFFEKNEKILQEAKNKVLKRREEKKLNNE